MRGLHQYRPPEDGPTLLEVHKCLYFLWITLIILQCGVIVHCDGAAFGEPCTVDGNCSYIGAACSPDICNCNDSGYFTNNAKKRCEAELHKPCGENTGCYRNGSDCIDATCQCFSTHYEPTTTAECVQKKIDGEACSAVAPCRVDLGLSCLNATCACNNSDPHFWDPSIITNPKCKPVVTFGHSCPSGLQEECQSNAVCINNNCTCDPGKFWNPTEEQCYQKKIYNETCQISSESGAEEPCGDEVTQCTSYDNMDSRCRCEPNYFRNTELNQCEMMTLLIVTHVTISEFRETELDVDWTISTLNQFVNRYVVNWNSSHGDGNGPAESLPNMKTIGGLTQGVMYTINVTTVESASRPGVQFVSSDTISQRTKPGPPGTILTAQNYLNATTFWLVWTQSPGEVDQYKIELAERDRYNNTVDGAVPLSFISERTSKKVEGLKHGQRYMVTVTAKAGTLESASYREMMRTNPTAPGNPLHVSCDNITDIDLILRWTAPVHPNGDIRSYRVITNNVSLDDTNSFDTSYKVLGLNAGMNYIFTVITENDSPDKFGIASAALTCTTADALSDMPQMFKETKKTSRSVTMSWKLPANSNGDIHSYTIVVKYSAGSTDCIKLIVVRCNTCSSNEDLTNPCQNGLLSTDLKVIEENDLRNKDYEVQYKAVGLDPYTDYKVLVYASNGAGYGHPAEIGVTTREEVPQTPHNVTASNITGTSLDLIWEINGPRPGLTNYTVIVYEVTDSTSTILSEDVIAGFENRVRSITGLEEFTTYKFTVIARTSMGRSSSESSREYITSEAPPLQVRSFSISKVTTNNYTSVIARWMDPLPKDKNGILEKYILAYKINIELIGYVRYNISPVEGDVYSRTLDVLPEQKYSFKVQGINRGNLDGPFVEQNYSAPAGPPPNLENTGVKILAVPSETETAFISFKIVVVNEFFTDATNGKTTTSGLIVCNENKCDDDQSTESAKKRTWKQAKQDGFPPYRATNDTWKQNLQTDKTVRSRRSVTTKYYIIGDDISCGRRSENVFCNGPLPDSSTFMVKAFVCTNGGCTFSELYGPFVTRILEEPGNLGAAIGGGVGAGILLVVVILLVLFFIRRRNKGYKKTRKSSDDIENGNEEEHLVDLAKICRVRPIKLSELPDKLLNLHCDSNLGFAQEYEDLKMLSPTPSKTPADAAVMDENKVKNRYVNILPFDHSRVKLLPTDDDPSSDYINSNYLPGYSSPREFIACQGPIPGTIEDFWRMVWEQEVNVIVMLTLCKEDGRVKCEQYWPDEQSEPKQYGDLVVTLESSSTVNYYDHRIFEVTLGNKPRKIRQFQFLIWKDFSADVTHKILIDFICYVRSQITPPDARKPLVIHCSAGVGRTGTYICLDHLIQIVDEHMNKNGTDLSASVDIFGMVLKMRQNRVFMVQTEQQYVFIHDCIMEYITMRREELDSAPEEPVYDNEGFEPEIESEQLYENSMFQKTEL